MSVCPSKAGFHPEIGYETLEILNVMQPQNFLPGKENRGAVGRP